MTDSPATDNSGSAPCVADPGTVSLLLQAASEGDSKASSDLLAVVYQQLHVIARGRMSNERSNHTLQPTALVHEAYMKLLGHADVRFDSRAHFFSAAAESMRRILIDHARGKNAGKRGGGKAALRLSSILDVAEDEDAAGILSMDEAIQQLEKADPRSAEIVRLRFYAGLTEEAVAELLGLSARTIRREWVFARAWLRDSLQRAID